MPDSNSWLTTPRLATYAVICITLLIAGVRASYSGLDGSNATVRHSAPYTGDAAPLMAVAKSVLAAESTAMTSPASSVAARDAETRVEQLVTPRYRGTFRSILTWTTGLGSAGEFATFHTVLRLEASNVVDRRTVEITANELTNYFGPDGSRMTSYDEDHRFSFVRRGHAWALSNDVVLSCGRGPIDFGGQAMECDSR